MVWQTLKSKDQLTKAEIVEELMNESDAIIVGVGAGMTAADDFSYVGPRFDDNFPDFISKYKWLDMFQASVFNFESLEEEWGFFARFVELNYLTQPVGESFVRMREILKNRNHYVITSNADNAFEVADYDMSRVFYVQGKYNLLQCSKGCHPKRYVADDLIREMLDKMDGLEVPSDLVPYCPECGAPMELNRRDHDDWMVEDETFWAEENKYFNFLNSNKDKKILYMELGCGYMAPQVIKHKFQRYTEENENSLYLTVNIKNYRIPPSIRERTIWINEDINQLMKDIESIEMRDRT